VEKAPIKGWRLLNRDGTFNVEQKDHKSAIKSDLYHWFLTLPWRKLYAVIGCAYLTINFIFACLYVACGPESLSAAPGIAPILPFWSRFGDAFFFSVQTFATIGYGKLVPNGILPNILVTFEAFVGLVGFAMATGLVFARFSRPTARVIFSKYAVINEHEKTPSLIFRLANIRGNQIVEAVISVNLSIQETTDEGETYRTFYELKLEQQRSPIFILTWTVVHAIEKDSPLYGMTDQKLRDAQAEIIVSLSGIDNSFSQPIHARFSYIPDDILWNKRFKDMVSPPKTAHSKAIVDIGKIHDIV
jgi:inward rectifier potassium channel